MNKAVRKYFHTSAWDTICLTTTCFVGLAIIMLLNSTSQVFEFASNVYVIVPAIEVLINIILLVALYRRKGNFHARLWFAISIIGFILLGIGQLFERLSTNSSQALFWSHLGAIGILLIPIGFYMFVNFFTGKRDKHNDALIPALSFLAGGILLSFTISTESIDLIQKSYGRWGYDQPISTQFLIYTLWLGVIVSLGIIRLIKHSRVVKLRTEKLQSRIIIISASVALAGSLLLDVLPNYLGHNIVPLSTTFVMILPIGVIYAIYRYNTFAIDFSSIIDDVFDALAEGVIITDTNFNIRMANNFALTLCGYTLKELSTDSIKHLFDPEVFDEIISAITSRPSETKVIDIADSFILNASGNHTVVSVSVTKLHGTIEAYMFGLIDISPLKKLYSLEDTRNKELLAANENFRNQEQAMLNLLEDSRDLSDQLQQEKEGVEQKVTERTAEVRAERARLEASIDSIDIGFVIVDKEKHILTANGAYRNIVDDKPDHIIPGVEQLAKLLEGSFDITAAIEDCLHNGETRSENNLQLGEKAIRIFIAPIFEDPAKQISLGAVVLVEDITEAKALERSRDEFFSIASHELRTPLTAIRGNTKMIMDYYKEALSDPSLSEMVDDIHDSSIRLITIVNDFLDTSRLEQGKISFNCTDIDIVDLVEEVAQEFKVGEVNTDLYIKIKTPKTPLPLVHADRDRLKQTIINLVGNGFKFTDKGGVTINLKQQDATVFIEVSDTGKGIPAESRSLLFRKFQQASNNILTRDSTRSTGLGLYISKLIIEGMSGKIYMSSSEVDKGSTFTIEIPAATESNVDSTPKS